MSKKHSSLSKKIKSIVEKNEVFEEKHKNVFDEATEFAKQFSFYFDWNVYNREIPSDPLDIYVTTPPCQAFSLSGKRKGEKDKRGILFYNSHEFIVKNKPKFFIFENVKGLLSDDGGKTFKRWIDYLGGKSVNGHETLFPHSESVPYHVYYKVLNAKEYGIPQNRERIFIIGIRDDADDNFYFPHKFRLKKRLKDILESEVDEKYFLSNKMIESLISHQKFNKFNPTFGEKIGSCITSRVHKMGNSDNYIEVDKVGFINQDTQASKVISDKGVSSTISAGTHGYANGYIETELNQIGSLYDNNSDGGRIYDTEGIGRTIKSEGGGCGAKTGLYLVDENPKILGYTRDSKGNVVSRHEQDIANTIHTATGGGGNTDQFCIIPANNKKGFEIAEEEEDYINFQNINSNTRRGRVGKKVSQTLDTGCSQGILTKKRIRRLTPLECFKLMNFNFGLKGVADFKWNVSDTQAYKQAGNSIPVGVLVLLVKELLKIK